MARWALVLVPVLVFAGCAKQAPIGYDPVSPDEPTRAEAPPTGGAVVDFGAKVADVRAKCAAERGAFSQSGKVSTCVTPHAALGAALITLVEYCGGAACRIHTVLMLEHADATSWLVPFAHLRGQLLEKFGDPDQNDTQFPADCQQDFAGCVKSGAASALLQWRWDDGHAVMLRIGPIRRIPAAISVSYSDAHGALKH
jgi:hypothetical protein